jgi:hypothetical protein
MRVMMMAMMEMRQHLSKTIRAGDCWVKVNFVIGPIQFLHALVEDRGNS